MDMKLSAEFSWPGYVKAYHSIQINAIVFVKKSY